VTKLDLLDTGSDKRFVHRDAEGRFKEEVDVGKSLAVDQRQHSKTVAKRGEDDRAIGRNSCPRRICCNTLLISWTGYRSLPLRRLVPGVQNSASASSAFQLNQRRLSTPRQQTEQTGRSTVHGTYARASDSSSKGEHHV
jgi:hypothetical protein